MNKSNNLKPFKSLKAYKSLIVAFHKLPIKIKILFIKYHKILDLQCVQILQNQLN